MPTRRKVRPVFYYPKTKNMEHKQQPDNRISVRIDKRTVILVKEGVDIEAHRKRYLEREATPPNYISW